MAEAIVAEHPCLQPFTSTWRNVLAERSSVRRMDAHRFVAIPQGSLPASPCLRKCPFDRSTHRSNEYIIFVNFSSSQYQFFVT
jgi:hypothetical protein